jgi:hypothetical protein
MTGGDGRREDIFRFSFVVKTYNETNLLYNGSTQNQRKGGLVRAVSDSKTRRPLLTLAYTSTLPGTAYGAGKRVVGSVGFGSSLFVGFGSGLLVLREYHLASLDVPTAA